MFERDNRMSNIKETIKLFADQLALEKSISTSESERKAGVFLMALAYITETRHLLSEAKIKLQSIHDAVYHQELSKCEGGTITANKITVEGSKIYATAREELENFDNDISYLKAYSDIFNNAHVYYRQMSKNGMV